MSLEDDSPNPEVPVIETLEDAPFIRKATAELDRTRQLPAYQALTALQEAHQLKGPLYVLFSDIQLSIPYKSPNKGIIRGIDEVKLNAGSYENEDERYSAFSRTLPDLRMLIAFGSQTLGKREIYARIREDIEITGGIGLTQEELAKYNDVDLSQYDLAGISFRPRKTDFRLVLGEDELGRPLAIDTRFVRWRLPKGKTHLPNEWQKAFEEAYSTIL